jgi:hypothetical protein
MTILIKHRMQVIRTEFGYPITDGSVRPRRFSAKHEILGELDFLILLFTCKKRHKNFSTKISLFKSRGTIQPSGGL